MTLPIVSPAAQSGDVSSIMLPKLQPKRRDWSKPPSMLTPRPLPKAILHRPSAMPPQPTAQAARTWPDRMSSSTCANMASVASASKGSAYRSASRSPGALSSGVTTLSTLPEVTAKLTRVGGTSISSKLPDMLSFPPMAAMPRPSWASSAPRSAAKGLPQRSGSVRRRSKYSWKLRYTRSCPMPEATSRDALSTTAR